MTAKTMSVEQILAELENLKIDITKAVASYIATNAQVALIKRIEPIIEALREIKSEPIYQWFNKVERNWITVDCTFEDFKNCGAKKRMLYAAPPELLPQPEPIYQLLNPDFGWHDVEEALYDSVTCEKRIVYLAPQLKSEMLNGWKLVPVEPTEEMLAAGDKHMDGLSRLSDAYESMLGAAPQPVGFSNAQIEAAGEKA